MRCPGLEAFPCPFMGDMVVRLTVARKGQCEGCTQGSRASVWDRYLGQVAFKGQRRVSGTGCLGRVAHEGLLKGCTQGPKRGLLVLWVTACLVEILEPICDRSSGCFRTAHVTLVLSSGCLFNRQRQAELILLRYCR